MSVDYSHLHSSIRPLADESAQARIRRIRTDRWITYARAESALASIEDLLSFPKRTRMPNILIVGPTNNGKTMIVEKFRRGHPATEASATEDGAARVPVLKIQMPPGPCERRFFGAILDALGLPFRLLTGWLAVRMRRFALCAPPTSVFSLWMRCITSCQVRRISNDAC